MADRAYLDFKWFHQLQARGVTFVTRLKRGVRYRVTREHDIRPGTGVLSDQTIELASARSRKAYDVFGYKGRGFENPRSGVQLRAQVPITMEYGPGERQRRRFEGTPAGSGSRPETSASRSSSGKARRLAVRG